MKKLLSAFLVFTMLLLTACSSKGKWEEEYERGLKLMKEGEYEDAIEAFTNAIEMEPEEAKVYVHRGTAYTYEARRIHERRGGKNNTDAADNAVTEEDNSTDSSAEDTKKIKKYIENAEADFEKAEEIGYEETDKLEEKTDELEELKEEVGYSSSNGSGDPIAALTQMEYAIFVAGLQDMGCEDVQWEMMDGDMDGEQELYAVAIANDWGRQSLMLADVGPAYCSSYVATGAAGDARYITADGYDSILMEDGYYSAGNPSICNYIWTGSVWEEVNSDLGNTKSAEFSCLDLNCTWVNTSVDEMTKALDRAYDAQGVLVKKLTADMNGDGLEEHIYILQNAANVWFDRLDVLNSFGDECYHGYFDTKATAIVVSEDEYDEAICVRMCRLEWYQGGIPEIKDGQLVLDGVVYDYQAEGAAFVTGEILVEDEVTLADIIIDGKYIEVALPSDWNGHYRYEFYQESDVAIYMIFDELGSYEEFGGGHLFSICMVDPAVDNAMYPSRENLGTVYLADKQFCLFVTYPTDVQFSDATAAQYRSMEEDIDLILSSISPKSGVEIVYY